MRYTLAALAVLFVLAAVLPAVAGAAPSMTVGIEQEGTLYDAATRDKTLDYQKSLGSKTIRFMLRFDRFSSCDPASKNVAADSFQNPCYDWSTADAVIKGAKARGMAVVVSIMGAPQWVFNQNFNYTGTTEAEFDRFVSIYDNYAEAAAKRYNGKNGLPYVAQWTIWNEPNGAYFWANRYIGDDFVGPRRYAELVNSAARRIKSVSSSFKVAAGPTAPMAPGAKPGDYVAAVLPVLNRLHAPINAWAHNAYVGKQPVLSSGMRLPEIGLGNINDLTKLMDRYKVTRKKPVWITEFGYETNPPDANMGISLDDQSNFLAEAEYAAWRNPRIMMFMWYGLTDDGDAHDTSGFESGLLYNQNSCAWCAKPAAYMFQHPLWVSDTTVTKGQKVVLWGAGRLDSEKTKIYLWQGSSWQYFGNDSPFRDDSIYVTFTPTTDTWFVACDSSCGPMRKVTVQ